MHGWEGGSGETNTVQYAQINGDGSIGTWSNQATNMPQTSCGSAATTYNGFIYINGGSGNSSDEASSKIVAYGRPGSDGKITSWQTSPNLVPTGLRFHSMLAYNGYLYVVAGAKNDGGDAANRDVFYARINSDGSIGVFNSISSTWFPNTNCQYANKGVTIGNGFMYFVCFGTSYYAKILSDGSVATPIQATSPSISVHQGQSAILNGFIYYFGGELTASGIPTNIVSYAPINNNGSLGAWVNDSTALPAKRSIAGVFTANNYVYILGGSEVSISNTQSTVYYTGGPRTRIAGGLDLLNYSGESIASASGTGGTLSAGNTHIVGTLNVNSNAWFGDGLGVRNNLSLVGQAGFIGLNGTQPVATISGNTSFAAMVVDNRGGGDLFTASKSGAKKFTVFNNGNVEIVGTATTCTIGNGTSATNCSSSDQRLKDNIASLSAGTGLDAIRLLNPVSYNWNAWMQGNGSTANTQYGFIAQELATVFPNLVEKDANSGYYKLDYQGLFAPIIKSLQELDIKLEDSDGSLAQLSSKLGILETDYEAISDSLEATNLSLANVQQQASGNATLASQVTILQTNISSLSDKVASMEATLDLLETISGFSASSGAELNLDKLNANEITVSDKLTVLGRTLLNDVGITGKINMGLLTITGLDDDGYAAINTTAGPLKLQSDGFNGVDILNGKVTIDAIGNIKTTAAITAKKYNVDTTEALSASLGEATLEAGQTLIDIETSAVTSTSAIFVTPKTKTELPLSVTQQVPGTSFRVELSTPDTKDIKFNWWIVN